MPIFQCPECELRFTSASELDGHLQMDHPDFEAKRRDEGSAIPDWQKRQLDREQRDED